MTAATGPSELSKAEQAENAVANYVAELSTQDKRLVKTLRANFKKIGKQLPLCGELCESLKWGELSFSTESPKTGTPVRLSTRPDEPGICTLSVHCQTTLIAEFREMYPELRFDRNRSLLVNQKELSSAPVMHFLEQAMTYHVRKKSVA